ncbi:hypothetical protein PILCRDRAFT_821892 [Piloderma croceum F 1598]|uniref:Uncharacterized protein n=1 Tax=Piloderma croceum (strain F 1598) TaxID=765440 RepID=A0A0C3BUN3_PILCF|nr:hypothetical protein PILCRDRAFT_821892 [Piloderma croceum F 1598]
MNSSAEALLVNRGNVVAHVLAASLSTMWIKGDQLDGRTCELCIHNSSGEHG